MGGPAAGQISVTDGSRRRGRVEIIDPRAEPGWDEAVAGSSTELFISRPWLDVIGDVFDLKIQAVVTRDSNGSMIGLLPFCAVDDPRGARISILPFSDFVEPLVHDDDHWDTLVAPIIDRGVPIRMAGMADSPARGDARFAGTTSAVRHRVPLDGPAGDLTDRFAAHHRRLIRKAERAGIEFRCATSTDELRAFYELHLGVRRTRFRMLAQPYQLFEELWDRFVATGRGALIVGLDGTTVAGGCLLLEAGDTLYYKYAASHPGYRAQGVSHGAVAAAIALGIERGHTALDLGRSDLDQPGLIDFKRRFGAQVDELSHFTLTGGQLEEPPAIDGMLSELTQLLTEPDVPPRVTEQASQLLYRLFA